MAGERYFKATMTGVTSPIYISYALACDLISHLDPSDDKRKIDAPNNKRASGEVRSEVDFQTLYGSVQTGVTITFEDIAGVTDKPVLLPKLLITEYKGETGNEDQKPARFSANFEAEVPA